MKLFFAVCGLIVLALSIATIIVVCQNKDRK